jgi:hypothetical protein
MSEPQRVKNPMPNIQGFLRLGRRLDTQLTRAGERNREAALAQMPQGATLSPFRAGNLVLKTTFQFALRNPWFRVGVIVLGFWLVMAGLGVSLIVVAMFVQPGGIGMEKLLGPAFGFLALLLFLVGGVCLYLGFRVKAEVGAPDQLGPARGPYPPRQTGRADQGASGYGGPSAARRP